MIVVKLLCTGDLPGRALRCFAFDDSDPMFERLSPNVEFQNSDSGGINCVVHTETETPLDEEDKAVYMAELLDYSRYQFYYFFLKKSSSV